MRKTKHMNQRMSQRNISDFMIDIGSRFGEINSKNDKITLNQKSLCEIEKYLRYLLKTTEYMKKKKGIVIVEQGNCYITSYFMNSYKQGKNK